MGKLTTKQLKHKFTDGTEELVDLAVNAENVEEINFVTAENRENIRPREGLLIILGKISKWYASLKNVAWSGSYNDLADKPTLNDIEGILSVEKGGTGANTETAARKNLGLGAAATYGVSGNDTTNDTGLLANAAVVYNHRIEIDNLKRSFLDGVNKIYNKLAGLGFTPVANSPDAICAAIQDLYDNAGIKPEYFTMYSAREDFAINNTLLVVPRNGICHLKFEIMAAYSKPHNANTLTISVLRNETIIAYEEFDKDVTSDTGPYRWNKTIDINNCIKGETLTFRLNSRGSDVSWLVGLY